MERGKWEMTDKQFMVFFSEDQKVLKVDYGHGCTALEIYLTPLKWTL